MALNVDTLQSVKMALSSFNNGVTLSFIDNTAVNGANTFATFRARVVANIALASNAADVQQAGNMITLRGLDLGNRIGILTDTNLNGLTTVAGVRALYTTQDPSLSLTYTGDNFQ